MPTVETNGITTYYEEYGDGYLLLVLHGGSSDHQLMAEQLHPLSDDFRLIVYDLRGHGRTDSSDTDTYSIDLYVSDLAALIETLDLDRPVICGVSLGGMIGYKFAVSNPERLTALVTLGGPTPRIFSFKERFIRDYLSRLLVPLMSSELAIHVFQWTVKQLSPETESVDLDDIEHIRTAHSCEMAGESGQSIAERQKMMNGVREYIGTKLDWDRLNVPVLAMYGENEPLMASHAEFVASTVEQCRVQEIPGASHNSHVDNPDYIVSEIRQFLDETGRVGEPISG